MLTKTDKKLNLADPLLHVEERLRLLRGIRGMWENRKPDPIKELRKIRAGGIVMAKSWLNFIEKKNCKGFLTG